MDRTATGTTMQGAARAGSRQTDRPRSRVGPHLPLLAGAFVAVHAIGAALSLTLAEPEYEFALHVALSVGLLASLVGLWTGRNLGFLGSLVMVVAFVAYALRLQGTLPLTGFLYPPEVVADEETGLSALVAWFLVGFTFMQSRRENLVFIFVPGITVFGLMATRNLNPEYLGAFMVFVLASIFCWGYDHFLAETENTRQSVNWRDWARAHLSRAVLVFALAAVGGILIGNALYYTTPRMHTGFGLQPRVWDWAGARISGYFMFRDGFDIGNGPIQLSPFPVLKVEAAEAHLWGGRKYDLYTGGGWRRSQRATRRVQAAQEPRAYHVRRLAPLEPEVRRPAGEPLMGSPDGGGPPWFAPPGAPEPMMQEEEEPQLTDWEFEPLRGREFQARFEVIGSDSASLFAAAHPYRLEFGPPIDGVDTARPGGVSVDSYGALQTTMQMRQGQTYTMWSRLPEFTAEQLRSAPSGGYSAEFREQYIEQVSIEVAEALGPLVRELTADAETDYDRVMAIKHFLETKFRYTLDVPFTPRRDDPVVYFVTHTRRGACDLFGSALALMCRLADIPARIATGFNRGEYDVEQGAIIVRGEHAHAWTEVYFSGYGWVPFDPSAPQDAGRRGLAAWLRLADWRALTQGAWRLTLWILLVGGGLYLVTTALVDPWPYLRSLARRLRGRRLPRELLGVEYERLLRTVARRSGVRYRPAMTPLQLLERAGEAALLRGNPGLSHALQGLTVTFYDLRYGPEPAREHLLSLRREARLLRKTVRRARR